MRHRAPPVKIALRAAAALLLLILVVGVTVGGDIGRLTVINETDHYVHVIVDSEPFLYVPPGAGATFEKKGYSTVIAIVFYSPGQGVSGTAERKFVVAPYEPASTGCAWTTLECTTSPSTGGAVSWTVTADTLAAADVLSTPPQGTGLR